jgi:hypothetical protein
VLIREEEIVDEDNRGKPRPAVLPGDRCFNKHFGKYIVSFSLETL